MRQKLNNRRLTYTRVIDTGADKYYASFGLDNSDWTLREVFIRGSKIGSDMEILLDDASVILSLALQHGLPLEQLLHSLHTGREEGGTSILAKVIAVMNEETNEIKKAVANSRAASSQDVPEPDRPPEEGEGVVHPS